MAGGLCVGVAPQGMGEGQPRSDSCPEVGYVTQPAPLELQQPLLRQLFQLHAGHAAAAPPQSGPHKAGGLWECAPAALDHNVGCIVAGTHTLLYAFASNQLGQEPAHKGVTCSQPAAVSRQRSSSSQESAHVTCVVANACSAADTACAPPQCAALRRCAVLWCASNQFEANEATHIVRPSPLTTTTHLLRLCRPACPQAGQ